MAITGQFHWMNASSKAMTVVVEPWADEHCVPPGHILEISFDAGGWASVVTHDEGPSVYLEQVDDYRSVVRPTRPLGEGEGV